MIVLLTKEHARQVANLHISGIPTGFISSLGIEFVTALYEAIAESSYGFSLIEVLDNGRVVGFVAFTTNLKNLYKTVCLKHGLHFFFLLASKLFSLKVIKKIFETLFYPSKVQRPNLPQAELLSVAVDETERGKGIAQKLILHGLQQCAEMNITKVKVLVADFNEPANKLYQKIGFQYSCKIENHGTQSNIYVADTPC